ncbi:hypothetical protein XA68_14613 [Ophiocordyceps unilateralis]|uniref:Ketosynthase family 3 (KS3) domain-containing protein n=1 Tax=Ophiocordyceps unilateralis TaxID=268505 RepID=A0A2A9PN17_OPHUN|nr:hypothetical protein XA68_14613 [Ophiocordyceps unilateralis]
MVLQPSRAQHKPRHGLFLFSCGATPGLSKPEERRGFNVGGTNAILMPELQTAMASLHFLSPDCKSMAFDHKANGYARGEGAAVVILKPLSDALREGNVIRAVIRGSGVNQDGKTPGKQLGQYSDGDDPADERLRNNRAVFQGPGRADQSHVRERWLGLSRHTLCRGPWHR